MIAEDRAGAVDFARGNRSYITAVDMIDAAPISPGDDSFRFRFFNLAEHPGRWLSVADGGSKATGKAELLVGKPGRGNTFYFTCDDAGAPLHRVPDYDFRFDATRYRIRDRSLTGPLSAGVSLWQQLTEAVRHGGEQLFPGRRWVVVVISGSGQCLAPIASGEELHVDLLDSREQINVLGYTTSSGAQGRISIAPRPRDGG